MIVIVYVLMSRRTVTSYMVTSESIEMAVSIASIQILLGEGPCKLQSSFPIRQYHELKQRFAK